MNKEETPPKMVLPGILFLNVKSWQKSNKTTLKKNLLNRSTMKTNFVNIKSKHEIYEVAFWYEGRILTTQLLICLDFGALSLN